jgi:hypothetical protein
MDVQVAKNVFVKMGMAQQPNSLGPNNLLAKLLQEV